MNEAVIQKFFAGRQLVIATQHRKEQVLAPILEKALGVTVSPPPPIDTDHYGTFSGEVERTETPLRTACLKCDEAQKMTGATLVLASEGSFGAHPAIPFVTADEELLVLKDYRHGLLYKARLTSLKTNMAAEQFSQWSSLESFAERVRFPSHSLIVRGSREDMSEVHKGIRNWESLKKSFRFFLNKKGSVYVETDMRALHNPTRMEVIGEAAEKLVATILCTCPLCQTPGFDVIDVVDGLPCAICATPTGSTLAYMRHCQACHHREEQKYPHQKQKEDPMHCPACNP